MKKFFAAIILVAIVLTVWAADTQQRGAVQTSRFTREALTNETAVGWRSKLGVDTNGVPIDALTNNFDGTITASAFDGDGGQLTGLNANSLTDGEVNVSLIPSAIARDTEVTAATNALAASIAADGTAAKVIGTSTNTGEAFKTHDADVRLGRATMEGGGLYLSSVAQGDSAPDQNYRQGLFFMKAHWDGTVTTNRNQMFEDTLMGIQSYTNWVQGQEGTYPTFHQWSKGAIRIEPGFGIATNWGGENDTYLSIGNEDSAFRQFWANANDSVRVNQGIDNSYAPSRKGYSLPFQFHVLSTDATTNIYNSYPAIQGFGTSVTNEGFQTGLGIGNNLIHMGELVFWRRSPFGNTTNAHYFGQFRSEVFGGAMRTNGWQLAGRLILDHTNHPVLVATNNQIALNFDAQYSQGITLTRVTNTFYATNINTYGGLTNYEAKVFNIKSGGSTKYLVWPSAWTQLGKPGAQELPSAIGPYTSLLLTLRSMANSTTDQNTNILASWEVATYKPDYDTNAAAFFTAASITDGVQMGAVDYLVKALKAENLWTNNTILYPFVGGTSNSHSINLVNPATYGIVFTAAGVTHDANGITGNGTSGYGATGWALTNLGVTAVSNSFMAVYSRTTLPTGTTTPDVMFMGATMFTTGGHFSIGRSSASLATFGPMTVAGPTPIASLSSDFNGFHGVGLHPNNPNEPFAITRLGGSAPFTITPISPPTRPLFVLAVNQDNIAGPNYFSSVNLGYAAAGYGYTSNQMLRVREIVNTYEQMLGRNTVGGIDTQLTTAPSIHKYVVLREVQPNGVGGHNTGTTVSGTYHPRWLNSLDNHGGFATLNTGSGATGSNSFTLPAGVFSIDAKSPMYGSDRTLLMLTNYTDSSNVVIGSVGYIIAGNQDYATLSGRFTNSTAKTFGLVQYCQTGAATFGFGICINIGLEEIYTEVKITKEQ